MECQWVRKVTWMLYGLLVWCFISTVLLDLLLEPSVWPLAWLQHQVEVFLSNPLVHSAAPPASCCERALIRRIPTIYPRYFHDASYSCTREGLGCFGWPEGAVATVDQLENPKLSLQWLQVKHLYQQCLFVCSRWENPDLYIQLTRDLAWQHHGWLRSLWELNNHYGVKVVVDSAFKFKGQKFLIQSLQQSPIGDAHGVLLNKAATGVRRIVFSTGKSSNHSYVRNS